MAKPKLTKPIPGSFTTLLTKGVGNASKATGAEVDTESQPTVTVEIEVETTVIVEAPPATGVLVGGTIDTNALEVSTVADSVTAGTRSYA